MAVLVNAFEAWCDHGWELTVAFFFFCVQIETCRDVENALVRHDRSSSKLMVLPYHAALSQEARLESMQQFLESQPSKSLFLVCTDRYLVDISSQIPLSCLVNEVDTREVHQILGSS